MKIGNVDFGRSFVIWETHDGSRGRFTVECLCRITAEGAPPSNFYLLSAVLAGNVYAKTNLIKEPSYIFQSVFSETDYKIFRVFLHQNAVMDDFGPISSKFKKLHLKIVCRAGRPLESISELEDAIFYKNRLGVRLEMGEVSSGGKIILEFPVKHINLNKDGTKYQVETGPVVLPDPDQGGYAEIRDLNLAYIAFNDRGRTELAFLSSAGELGPKAKGALNRFYSKIVSVNAKTFMFNMP